MVQVMWCTEVAAQRTLKQQGGYCFLVCNNYSFCIGVSYHGNVFSSCSLKALILIFCEISFGDCMLKRRPARNLDLSVLYLHLAWWNFERKEKEKKKRGKKSISRFLLCSCCIVWIIFFCSNTFGFNEFKEELVLGVFGFCCFLTQ